MLRIDVRDLQKGPVRTVEEIPAHDPMFEGLGIELAGPLAVRGELQLAGESEYLWRGQFEGVMKAECRRCLAEVEQAVAVTVDAAVFSSDPDAADDPDFYPLPARATHVDVGEIVREELALAVPIPLVLCREDCAGLCPKCGADLNAGPCPCGAPA